MNLRPYQSDCIATINDYLASTDDHGVCALPTASGKTIIFATMIRDWLTRWPDTRVCILAHRQELLTQAETKLKKVWPAAPVGVWSAGLKRKQGDRNILIAGIQSVYKRACDFDPFDIIIVDEAHLIPNTSDTMYRRFLEEARLVNPRVRIIGFTATPYRLDGGDLCGPDRLFSHVIYDAPIRSMIDEKYLCLLRTKATATKLESEGLKVRQGEYAAGDMERKFNTDDLVESAVAEIVAKGADRRAWLIFSFGIEHARHISDVLARHGIDAPVVVGEMDKETRVKVLADFDAGKIRAVVNVNCLTTGLDVTRIDLIALLRCTLSTSLYVQMVGRGFRLHPDKTDCLVLDFGQNALRHGPLDNLNIRKPGEGGGAAPSKQCPVCEEIVAAAATFCPCCGYEFPPREIHHEAKASEAPILSDLTPWEVLIEEVYAESHSKPGKPTSLKVTYDGIPIPDHPCWKTICKICASRGGIEDVPGIWSSLVNEHDEFGITDKGEVRDILLVMHQKGIGQFNDPVFTYRPLPQRHREWICFEHGGHPAYKARKWWQRIIGTEPPATVNEALSGLFDGHALAEIIAANVESVRVRQVGKYTEIIDHRLRETHGSSAVRAIAG